MGNVHWNHQLSFHFIIFLSLLLWRFSVIWVMYRFWSFFPSLLDAVEEASLILQNISLECLPSHVEVSHMIAHISASVGVVFDLGILSQVSWPLLCFPPEVSPFPILLLGLYQFPWIHILENTAQWWAVPPTFFLWEPKHRRIQSKGKFVIHKYAAEG